MTGGFFARPDFLDFTTAGLVIEMIALNVHIDTGMFIELIVAHYTNKYELTQ